MSIAGDVKHRKPRHGWEDAFMRMAEQHADELLDADLIHKLSSIEEEEWQW